VCLERKAQQKIVWPKVLKQTVKWKSWWKIHDLLSDARCSLAVLDFLSTTDVGRRVPAEEDAVGEILERQGGAERRKSRGRRRSWVQRENRMSWVSYNVPTHALFRGILGRGLGGALRFSLFFLSFFCLSGPLCFFSFVIFLLCITSSWDRPTAAIAREAIGRNHTVID